MRFRRGTYIRKSQVLWNILGSPNLYIKDESRQLYGTWKDRRSKMIIEKASEEGVDKLVLITAGNAGYSLAKFAASTSIKVCLIIDKDMSPRMKKGLKSVCYRLVELDLSKKIINSKEAIALFRENRKEKIWDATNGFEVAFESRLHPLPLW